MVFGEAKGGLHHFLSVGLVALYTSVSFTSRRRIGIALVPMRSAIVIPARLGSTRLAQKMLLPLAGLPLVVRTAKQAQKCRNAGHVIVATDSPEIQKAVVAHGVEVMLTRSEHQSGSDRVAEVAQKIQADVYLNLQGDEPFAHPRDLEKLIDELTQSKPDMVTLRTPIVSTEELQNPSVVKVVSRDDGTALYFSRANIPFDRSGSSGYSGVFRHIGVYGYQHATLVRLAEIPPHALELREGLEQLRALARGLTIKVVDAQGAGKGIDTAEDFKWAEQNVRTLGAAAFPD